MRQMYRFADVPKTLWVWFLIVALSACRDDRDAPRPTPPKTVPSTPATTTPDAHPPDRCADQRAAWDAALDRASYACKNDNDCACYNGGISERSGCGGVAAAASAAELERLRAEYQKSCTPGGLDCAPGECKPRCEQGRCVK